MLHHHFKRNLFQFLKKEGLNTKINLDLNDKKQKLSFDGEIVDHYPVMYKEIEQLISEHVFSGIALEDMGSINANKVMLDCTLGTAGHTKRLIEKFPFLYVLGVDVDERIIKYVQDNVVPRMKPYDQKRFLYEKGNYRDLEKFSLKGRFGDDIPENAKYNCILADFGFSSLHVDNPDWGFSNKDEGLLDMRYDKVNSHKNAGDLVNEASALELANLFQKFGEEPASELIAKLIVKEREKKKFHKTTDLSNLIFTRLSANKESKRKIITRVFQALRIAVNNELSNIEELMDVAVKNLADDGIGLFITFHSLEERIVFDAIKSQRKTHNLKILEQKLKPSKQEIQENVRSRSAKLFAYKKLKAPLAHENKSDIKEETIKQT